MQAFLAARSIPLALGKRAFASSARSWQAVPQQKPVLMKEFKIYRWVSVSIPTSLVLSRTWLWLQNPDEPDKKPSLQTYQLDLNQTGPMVSRPETFFFPPASPQWLYYI
jgi:succinate dehydrogenase (ubiquinone) iron-sulfur subunit